MGGGAGLLQADKGGRGGVGEASWVLLQKVEFLSTELFSNWEGGPGFNLGVTTV